MATFPAPFDPAEINGMHLRNRFVRSATWEGMAGPDGLATPELAHCMADLAQGGVGLVVSGHAYVHADGQAGPRQLAANRDECLPGLTQLAKAVHEHGGACALQLAHAGAHALSGPTGTPACGPSALDLGQAGSCDSMTCEHIGRLVDDFAVAARRAREAGFDAVQIHAAHGYCLSQFLSPHYNQRSDEYGGPLENRARFLLEVLQAVRADVGGDYPVLIKLNAQDFLEDGLTSDETLLLCRRLENMDLDAVELSGGTAISGQNTPVRRGRIPIPEGEAWYRDTARQFKKERGLPLMLVGGIRSLETAEELLREQVCDFISLSRPLIREPGLVRRWQDGDRRPADCISDNLCFKAAIAGGLACPHVRPGAKDPA